MKNFLNTATTILIVLLTTGAIYAGNFSTTKNGKWKKSTSWDNRNKPGTYWGTGDTVFVYHRIDLDENIGFSGTLIIGSGGSLIGSNRDISTYSGGSIYADGVVDVKKLNIGNNSTAVFNEDVDVKNDFTAGQEPL